ncbi:carbohydrate deacetylase [Actinomyces sp. MRS3W]|uniref:carbohydrate deacetylase n=1 Tax=Actinomyces sp. MRS3W TaxID=2800796 RepID=UPI0028FD9D9D|nr:ChbG/HpnK family deacetylase [Actinomyces sp. MRS3W]MDU0349179.1 ChbG/HpnK family deacetylase [Actinomyces sp. MRS3W]
MNARRLVLTADDYGYDPASAEVVLDLLQDGYVSATTVLAVSEYLDDVAPQLAALRANHDFGVGLHVSTNSDRGREPWTPLSPEGSVLADPDGNLPADPSVAEERATPEAISAEVTAQMIRMRAVGLAIDRIDSHSGTVYGLHGGAGLAEVLTACARRRLAFRFPRILDATLLGGQISPTVAQAHRRALRAADDLGVALPQTLLTDPRPTDMIGSYENLRDFYIGLLPLLPEGTSEIFAHPGADTAWARERFGAGWDKRVWEARMLRDPAWRDALEREGIEVVARW